MFIHKIGTDYSEVLKTRKTKRELPLVGRLSLSFDIERLKSNIMDLIESNRPKISENRFAADPASSEHNYHLKTMRNESFIQNYDEFYSNYSLLGLQELTPEARSMANSLNFRAGDLSPVARLKGMKNTAHAQYHPHYDERNYTVPTQYQVGYIEEVLRAFRSETCRSAVVVLAPGKFISPHFDIGPEFITRLHVPLFTNPKAVFGIRNPEGIWEEYHFPADGSAFFVNAGYEHYAFNGGDLPRLQLRICLNGQEDMDSLESLVPVQTLTDAEVRARF